MPFSSSAPGASFCKRSTSPKISFSDAPVTAVVTSAVSTQYASCTRREIWLFGEYVYPFCSRMLDVIREPNDPPSNVFVTASGILSGLSALGTGKPTKIVDCAAPGRSVTSSTCFACVLGAAVAAALPLVQPEKLSAMAFFTAAPSNRPATYKCARDLLRYGPRNRHLPYGIIFQAGQFGLRQQRMLRNIRKQFHRVRPELAQHVRGERALIFSDSHVHIPAHLREFFRELLRAPCRGPLLQQVAQNGGDAVLLGCLVDGARAHHQARRYFRQRAIRHQGHLHPVRQCVRLVPRKGESFRRATHRRRLFLRK